MFIKTQGSLLQSSIPAKKVGALAANKGWKAVVIANDNLFDTPDFVKGCREAGVKPIIGQRFYINDTEFIAVARNFEGFKHLSMLSAKKELSFSDFNNKNIINVIVSGEGKGLKIAAVGINKTPQTLNDSVNNNALNELWRKILPFTEACYENKGDDKYVNALKAVSLIKEKVRYHQIAIDKWQRVSSNAYIQEKGAFVETLSKEEIKNYGDFIKAAEDDFLFTETPTPPSYPFVENEVDFFIKKTKEGLAKRGVAGVEIYEERLQTEIDIIVNMGFPGYMLIVWDFVNYAKSNNIPVGPGRGSAAGSLVAYCLEITDIDPIKHGLLFERFLNPERVSMPDIDMDFCTNRRGEVIDYMYEKYGEQNVAQIITFGTLAARGAVRNLGTAMGLSLPQVDKMAKGISDKPGTKLENEKNVLTGDLPEKVWSFAKRLEGNKTHYGKHAAGVVVSPIDPVATKCPVIEIDGRLVTQFEMGYMEPFDLIKFDFLGLKTLSVIEGTLSLLGENRESIKKKMSDLDDSEVFELISSGKTKGLFQIESSGMQDLAKRLQPERFEDLVAMIALYRPGPMESGMLDDFIERKHGRADITYMFPELKPILKPTYGVIVYQEQVMQIVQTIAGFSLGKADMVRRAMGKKKKEEMDKLKGEFANGAEKKGFDKVTAEKLFDLIEKFAGYGFNKSHSAAYAVITYQTAYLKKYANEAFSASLLNYTANNDALGKMASALIAEGVAINKPNVNTSSEDFIPSKYGIEFGLSKIKNASKAGLKKILAEREKNGEYTDFANFVSRNKTITKKIWEALVLSGALSQLPGYPGKEAAFDMFKSIKSGNVSFSEEKQDTLSEMLKMEQEAFGFFLTDPFQKVSDLLDQYQVPELDDLAEGRQEILVFPASIEKKRSKKGKEYAVIKAFFNKKVIDVLAFNQSVNSAMQMNTQRPSILAVSVTDSGTLFLNGIKPFTKSVLDESFCHKG